MAVEVTDLGPASSNFSGHHNLVVGDTYYIGSRDVFPARIVGYHLPTGRTTTVRDFEGYRHVSALVADGRTLYVALQRSRHQNTVFTWDLDTARVEEVATVPDMTVWALKKAGDGVLYVVGQESQLSLNELDLSTGTMRVVATPDAEATQAPTIVVTEDRVYFGTGGQFDGRDTVLARLYEIDRESGAASSVLPPELAADLSIVGLAMVGDRLYVGTKSMTRPAHFAVLSGADHAIEFLDQPAGTSGFWALIEVGDDICFFSGTKVYRYQPDRRQVTELADFGGAIAGGLQHFAGTMLAMAWPMPWPSGPAKTTLHAYDIATGTLRRSEIAELTATGEPQPLQSLAAGCGRVYAAAWHLDEHDPQARTVTKVMEFPRTVKAMVVKRDGPEKGAVYAAVHDAGQLWRYEPGGGAITEAGTFPPGHTRPWDIAWDEVNDLVVVAAGSDRPPAASLTVHGPGAGELSSVLDPLGAGGPVRAVTTGDGLVYLGGAGPAGGRLGCWDPVAGARLWVTDTGVQQPLSTLAWGKGLLYGVAEGGTFLVFDAADGRVLHRADLPAGTWPHRGKLVWHDERTLYGGSGNAVLRIDPATFEITPLVTDLKGSWVGGRPSLAVDESGCLYTLRGSTLVRVRETGGGPGTPTTTTPPTSG